MGIFFVKMSTGEEVISEIHRLPNGDVSLVEPLTLEYGEQDGAKFIFLSRYCPFIEAQSVVVSRSHVVFMRPVLEDVGRYYRSSVDYCRAISDENFKKGIRQATIWTSDLISGRDEQPDDDPPVSSTVH